MRTVLCDFEKVLHVFDDGLFIRSRSWHSCRSAQTLEVLASGGNPFIAACARSLRLHGTHCTAGLDLRAASDML